MRSTRYLMNYPEVRDKLLYCWMGDEMGSSPDLMDCQESKTGIPLCEVGRGNMILSKGLRSFEESSN
jgi:hypothetical protein